MTQFEVGDIVVCNRNGRNYVSSRFVGGTEYIVLNCGRNNMILSGPDMSGWTIKSKHIQSHGEGMKIGLDNGWDGWSVTIGNDRYRKVGNIFIDGSCYQCKHACKMKESCPLYEEREK